MGLEEVMPKIQTSFLTTVNDEETIDSTRTTNAGIYELRKASDGEPERVLFSKNGNHLLTYNAQGIRYLAGSGGYFSKLGLMFYSIASAHKLPFINNLVVVFEYDVEELGNSHQKLASGSSLSFS